MKFTRAICILLFLFRIKSVLLNATTVISTNDADTKINGYKQFDMFKYFVYPRKFNLPSTKEDYYNNLQSPGENVTINIPMSSRELENDEEIQFYPLQTYRQYPTATLMPYNFGGGSMEYGGPFGGNNRLINMADPLFLMATLAFVAFLINSILGLVDRLGGTPVVRARQWKHRNYQNNSLNYYNNNSNNGGGMIENRRQRNLDGIAGDFWNDIEVSLKLAIERFEKKLLAVN